MLTDLVALLASHTATVTADPIIVRLLAGSAIGLGLIATLLWKLAQPRTRPAESTTDFKATDPLDATDPTA